MPSNKPYLEINLYKHISVSRLSVLIIKNNIHLAGVPPEVSAAGLLKGTDQPKRSKAKAKAKN